MKWLLWPNEQSVLLKITLNRYYTMHAVASGFKQMKKRLKHPSNVNFNDSKDIYIYIHFNIFHSFIVYTTAKTFLYLCCRRFETDPCFSAILITDFITIGFLCQHKISNKLKETFRGHDVWTSLLSKHKTASGLASPAVSLGSYTQDPAIE